MNRFFTKSFVLVALVGAINAFASSNAQAAQICTSCEYVDGFAGTYLGTYNPATNDFGTFNHTEVTTGTVIDDRWVFDVAPAGDGSTSADVTALAAFTGFTGKLFIAGGTTTCGAVAGSSCTVAALGSQIASDIDPDAGDIDIGVVALNAGRYIFQITGTASSPQGTYTGQIATANPRVPEPAMLSLLGVGLAIAARRRRKA
jgi:hypothetical protein